MKSLFSFRLFGRAPEDAEANPMVSNQPAAQPFAALASAARFPENNTNLGRQPSPDKEAESPAATVFKTIGWISAGLGALTLGLVVGREIRVRYKFNRRTPYDFYAHAGDERDLEFGVGI